MSAIRLYRENIEHPGHNDAALRRRRHEGRECQKNKKRRARKNEGQGRTIQALGQAASTPESLEPPQGPHGGAGLAAPPARVRGAPGHSSHRQDQAIAAKYPASPTATQHRWASVPVPARANARRSRGLWLNVPDLPCLASSTGGQRKRGKARCRGAFRKKTDERKAGSSSEKGPPCSSSRSRAKMSLSSASTR